MDPNYMVWPFEPFSIYSPPLPGFFLSGWPKFLERGVSAHFPPGYYTTLVLWVVYYLHEWISLPSLAGAPKLCNNDDASMRDPQCKVMLSGRTSHTCVENTSFFGPVLDMSGGYSDLGYKMLCNVMVISGKHFKNQTLKSTFEHMELPAKPLNYFFRWFDLKCFYYWKQYFRTLAWGSMYSHPCESELTCFRPELNLGSADNQTS